MPAESKSIWKETSGSMQTIGSGATMGDDRDAQPAGSLQRHEHPMLRDLGNLFVPLVPKAGISAAIVLTGAGEKRLPGGDLKQRNNMTTETWLDQHLDGQRGMFMADCPVPIIVVSTASPTRGIGDNAGLRLQLLRSPRQVRHHRSEPRHHAGGGGVFGYRRIIGSGGRKSLSHAPSTPRPPSNGAWSIGSVRRGS